MAEMVVEDHFDITGRGLVVVGIPAGSFKTGYEVTVKAGDSEVKSVAHLESFSPNLSGYIGLGLPNLTKSDVPIGAVISQ